jgi:hypothetical protein
MAYAELVAFMFLGCACTYMSFTLEEFNLAVLSVLFSAAFWVASIFMWFYVQDQEIALLGYFFLFPLGLNVVRMFEVLTQNKNLSMKKNPFE